MSIEVVNRTGVAASSTDGAPAPASNLLHVMFTGLGADPGGPASGMRKQAEQLLLGYPRSTYAIVSWDGEGWGEDAAIAQCKKIVDLIVAGNQYGPFNKIILRGHSFGGCFLVYFLNWTQQIARTLAMSNFVNLVILLDPVPEMSLAENSGPLAFVGQIPVAGRTPWTVSMDFIGLAYQFTQHNGMAWWFPVGPNGTPVTDPTNSGRLFSIAVGDWVNPKIYHSDVPADPRTWDMQQKLIEEVMK